MATIPPLIAVDQAAVTRHADGRVLFDDPDSPIIVLIGVARRDGTRHQVAELIVQARHPAARITSAALGRLPLAQMLHVAAGMSGSSHPNEAHYRSLIRPKGYGQRSWPVDHWSLVWQVYRWAQDTGRPGGGAQAIADLWGVSVRPTAYRWLREARLRFGTVEPPPVDG